MFSKQLLTTKLYSIVSLRLGEKGGTPSEFSWNSFIVLLELLQSPPGTPLVFISVAISFILSMIFLTTIILE